MKKMISTIVLSLALTGCVAANVKESVVRNAKRVDKMVALIDSGLTTREQEQNYIRSSRASFHSLNYYLNGTELPEDLRHLAEDAE